jgi:hypothetical protein
MDVEMNELAGQALLAYHSSRVVRAARARGLTSGHRTEKFWQCNGAHISS